ncbi:MAG: hypothetical protein SRB2_01207 [Desulfobacteraceae bacterium Eth-SRB2]|nr:MAG: hypothetical protein SRB2_01207 [Desulfobacteraceae bacterium Eth-SRB2]
MNRGKKSLIFATTLLCITAMLGISWEFCLWRKDLPEIKEGVLRHLGVPYMPILSPGSGTVWMWNWLSVFCREHLGVRWYVKTGWENVIGTLPPVKGTGQRQ